MAYTEINFKTKKALKEAFKAGKKIRIFQPGPFPLEKRTAYLEGPHYPAPHTWYSKVEHTDGVVTRILG